MPKPLAEFARKGYSQFGEEGVIAEIVRRLGLSRGWFADVGAVDGVDLSNTYALLLAGWRGVYVEGSPGRGANLRANVGPQGGIPIIQWVSREPGERLEDIFGAALLPWDFDLLNLDIDGNDYWVWKDLARKPAMVVIEYNPHFPPTDRRVMPYNRNHEWKLDDYYGATAGALFDLGEAKGYVPVAQVGVNLFFVRSDDAKPFDRIPLGSVARHRYHLQSSKVLPELQPKG